MILFIVLKKMENLTYCVCSVIDKETLEKIRTVAKYKKSS